MMTFFRSLIDSKAQAVVEYLLLTIVVVFLVMIFAINPTAPSKEAFNMILQDPIYLIHAGTNQIKI